MAANVQPIFILTPKAPAVSITAANVKNDGAGAGIATDMFILHTAGSNGSYIGRVRFVVSASAASTASTATVGRVYRSTQTSGATTNANTTRIDEIAIASITADAPTVQTPFYEIIINSFLNANETLLVSTHHAPAASTAVHALLMGSGDY